MSRERVQTGAAEVLEVIDGSRLSPTDSDEKVNSVPAYEPKTGEGSDDMKTDERRCNCVTRQDKFDQEVSELIKQREDMLRAKLEDKFERERNEIKERLESTLRNEQVRILHLQRDMQRKWQDKVDALKSQLECRNLAGLMYVICSERTKSEIEKMKIIEAYANHINSLQDLLIEGREIILYLSKGYKSAAKVDFEWREKMKEVVEENFLHQYMGGPPETIQYLLHLENLLKTNAPLYPDDDRDDVISEELALPTPPWIISEEDKNWWETVEDEDRPFLIFGDMEEMNPKEVMNIKKKIKAAKTAPKKWKQYVFNDRYFKAQCENLPKIKDLFQEQGATQKENMEPYYRQTTYSMDHGYAMGEVLKYVVTAGGTLQTAANKQTVASGILGAKDSLEIVSTVKILKEKTKNNSTPSMTSCEKILLGLRKGSKVMQNEVQEQKRASESSSSSSFKSVQDDSFRIVSANMPRNESQLTFEKICPVDRCKLMRMDSFLAGLPAYMRKSRRNVDYAYEDYEPCSSEQLRIIQRRLEEKVQKNNNEEKEDILAEWKNFVDGVGVQTSRHSIPALCTCPKQTTQYLDRRDKNDFLPTKQEVDHISKEQLFNSQIEFRRFKVVGDVTGIRNDCAAELVQDLRTIFRSHPSVASLFNTN